MECKHRLMRISAEFCLLCRPGVSLLSPLILGQCVLALPSSSPLNPTFDLSVCRNKLENCGFQVAQRRRTSHAGSSTSLFNQRPPWFSSGTCQRPGGATDGCSGCFLCQEIHGFQLGPVPFHLGTGTIIIPRPPKGLKGLYYYHS